MDSKIKYLDEIMNKQTISPLDLEEMEKDLVKIGEINAQLVQEKVKLG